MAMAMRCDTMVMVKVRCLRLFLGSGKFLDDVAFLKNMIKLAKSTPHMIQDRPLYDIGIMTCNILEHF